MANSDELITSVGKNSNDTAALVWSVADDLVGAYNHMNMVLLSCL